MISESRELLRVAREIIGLRVTVDESYISGLKRMMASDIRKLESSINSPEDAEKMRWTVNAVTKKWEDVFYNVILGREMSKLSEGSRDVGSMAERLRSDAWTAVIAFGDIGHHLAEWPRHWSKYPDDFNREKKYVFDRIKRAARNAYVAAFDLVTYRVDDQRTVDFGERVTVGNFILLPEGGITEDKIRDAAVFVRNVQSLVGRAGFKGVLSRMVVHVTNRSESGLKAGHYQPSDDSMAILPLGMSVDTMVHELGHRNWYTVLSAGDRDYWRAAFNGDLIEITREDVAEVTKGVRRTWQQGESSLPSLIRQSIDDYERSHGKDPVVPYKANYFRENVHYHDKVDFWADTWEKELVGQRVMRNYVTDYANTNEIEAYAEVFRNYVMKRPIPPEVLYWFRRVSG